MRRRRTPSENRIDLSAKRHLNGRAAAGVEGNQFWGTGSFYHTRSTRPQGPNCVVMTKPFMMANESGSKTCYYR
ncbi:MAG: hypothetical protein ICV68_05575 [Pyrinomonadaceae bacterium]|nr:hypothetical protein [Pyrinomonadaceae bacterium]